jgi:tRNA A37 methylthiotransferase MiaB
MASKNLPPASPTVGLILFGCPQNLVDSEVMPGLLDRAAHLEPILEAAACRQRPSPAP